MSSATVMNLLLSVVQFLCNLILFDKFTAEVIPTKRKRKIITTPSDPKPITYTENNASKITEQTTSPVTKRVEHDSKPLMKKCLNLWRNSNAFHFISFV